MRRAVIIAACAVVFGSAAVFCDDTPFGGGSGSGMGGAGGGMGGHMRSGNGRSSNYHPGESKPGASIYSGLAGAIPDVRDILTFDKELGLTAEQVDKIRDLRTVAVREALKRSEEVAKPREELAKIMEQGTPDFVAAKKKLKEITETQNSVAMVLLEAFENAYGILNADQKKKYSDIRTKLNEEKEKLLEEKQDVPEMKR
jgi:Spy/CpxP family protein refolding chaperone